jgi:hypothetical protein
LVADSYLAPENGHRIIGFYGTSGAYGMCKEFGIVTVEKDQQLPDSAYDYLETQAGHRSGTKSRRGENVSF